MRRPQPQAPPEPARFAPSLCVTFTAMSIEALYEACQNGDLDALKTVIDETDNINETDVRFPLSHRARAWSRSAAEWTRGPRRPAAARAVLIARRAFLACALSLLGWQQQSTVSRPAFLPSFPYIHPEPACLVPARARLFFILLLLFVGGVVVVVVVVVFFSGSRPVPLTDRGRGSRRTMGSRR